MAELELKGYTVIDFDDAHRLHDLELKDIYFLMFFYVGKKGEETRSDFQVMVATPEAIREKQEEDESVYPHRVIILLQPDFQEVIKFIKEKIAEIREEDLFKACEKLSRYFYWEYQDNENEA